MRARNEERAHEILHGDDEEQMAPERPLLRIWVCGPFSMQWYDPITGEIRDVIASAHPKDWSVALSLLALLLCQPHRRASRDWIMEQFWPESSRSAASHRLETIHSSLRKLLSAHPDGESLLHSLGRKKASGVIYQLETYPKIWVDRDALLWHVEQAARMQRFGDDPLPLWERAFELAKRGSLLPDEPYAEWAQEPRAQVAGAYRQCVHALAHLYQERHGDVGKEEALHLLRTYWLAHQTDEDALRPLMELLGEQERYQEAEEYYQQFLRTFAEDETDGQALLPFPDTRTHDIHTYLQMKQLRREPIQATPYQDDANRDIPFIPSLPRQHSGHHFDTGTPLSHRRSSPVPNTALPFPVSSFYDQKESDILARLSTTLMLPSAIQENEIVYFDCQTRLYWRAREETLLPATVLFTHVLRHVDDVNLFLLRSLSPKLRLSLCAITSKSMLLAGILLYDMGEYEKARQYYHVAWQAAREADDSLLQAIIWGWMSFTWTYTQCYPEALTCVQQARYFAEQISEQTVHAWLGAIEAEIQAHLQQRTHCLQALSSIESISETAFSQEISYLFELNPVLLLGYKGVSLPQLYRKEEPETHHFLEEAREALEGALAHDVPLKRRLYYLSDLASVYARQGEVEKACDYLTQSVPLLTQLGNGSKTIHAHLLQARHLLQPYQDMPLVRMLDEQMHPLLPTIGDRKGKWTH
jgi:DNA-binding SARP family transcriptional activator